MKTCETCSWWDTNDGRAVYHRCGKQPYPRFFFVSNLPGECGPRGQFVTPPEFGCTEHEPKDRASQIVFITDTSFWNHEEGDNG